MTDIIVNGIKIGEADFEGLSEAEIAAKLEAYQPKVTLVSVTPRQIRQALVLSGITLEMIDSAISSLPEPNKSLAHIEWEYSTLFIRSNPLVNMVGQMMGWTSGQIDELWIKASQL